MSGGYNPYNTSFGGSQLQQENDPYASPPPPPIHRQLQPSMHADSNFHRMQNERRFGTSSQQQPYSNAPGSPPRKPVASPINRDDSPSPPMHFAGVLPAYPPPASRSPPQARRPSPPRQNQYANSDYSPTMGGAAGGVGAALAEGIANDRAFSQPGNASQYALMAESNPYMNSMDHEYDNSAPYRHDIRSHDSYGSEAPLAAAAVAPSISTPSHSDSRSFAQYQDYSPTPSRHLYPNQYQDQSIPMSRSHEQMVSAAAINPNDILDDDDDFPVQPKRASRLNLPFNRSNPSRVNAVGGAGIGAGAIGDDVAGGFNRDPSGNYSSIPANRPGGLDEKNVWLADNSKDSRKWKKIGFIVVGLLIIAGIVVGTVVGVLRQNKDSSNSQSSSSQSAAADDASGDLSKNSAEIQKLMNNPDLHKVFSGFAYTPLGAQYPACLTNPPSQNNVTRDMAVLSQLTNVVRLYGTDCNQTEMVLHAIDRLQLTDMKIWLGVWLDNNDTTNTRQINQMWSVLDQYGPDNMKGVVVGNEVLFRKDLTAAQLGTYLSQTKANLTARNINLPVATSDLGDNWTAELASEVDVVMSNIHPFFGGVPIDQAAGWTYTFWQDHDVAVTKGMTGKTHIISEFGWPSAGGNDCGDGANCATSTQGAVASIPNMNTLMNDWVCQAMANGTDYFWFEAFDEPWKIQFNTANENWEDKWGLMDVNRNLKKGLIIPDCGGKTVGS
ncbi:hypothetical protein, variant [Verruconis gallopava]|uniref:glucan endo-1,3-beta-D-glucosidase n=1 Tax=Verruconis gallopava TaxID=253628 RepID=A0A0D2ACE4_9PEZI|nr:uncharacterized protein PV09_04278 [Verruconis gallopava]XP_016214393.1 hypothetical protein, variant [Verruconis gallopava]KIW04523.1 hypothetical protein PV09_04278 [Verruconis gallopava]KIW04524.1 hypothetical protein, variant [Verruconis gallopava]